MAQPWKALSHLENEHESSLSVMGASLTPLNHRKCPIAQQYPQSPPPFDKITLSHQVQDQLQKGDLKTRMCTTLNPFTGLIEKRRDILPLPPAGGWAHRMCLFIHPAEPVRVNLIYHALSGLHYGISAGPQGIINTLAAAKQIGHKVRFVVLEDFVPRDEFPQKLEHLKKVFRDNGYGDLLSQVDFWFAGHKNYSDPISVSPNDVFIAGYWPTAFVAHAAMRDLGRTHFIYLVSDYEPLFYPAGSDYAYSYETYTLPHHLLTNSPMMLKYLKKRRNSVFSGRFNVRSSRKASLPLMHPIARIAPDEKRIRERLKTNTRRVLIYARIMDRNCFDLIRSAIKIANAQGAFEQKNWEFYGIGHHRPPKMEEPKMIHLGSFPKEEYAKKLSDYDLGISLIMTPNVNFAQLDFAAAGMITVVNSFETKNQADYDRVGGNFIVGSPTSYGLAEAITEAVKRVEDVDSRLRGAQLSWSHSFSETYTEPILHKYNAMIQDIMHCRWITEDSEVLMDHHRSVVPRGNADTRLSHPNRVPFIMIFSHDALGHDNASLCVVLYQEYCRTVLRLPQSLLTLAATKDLSS
eukprot:CAMPEP_0117451826 /NCGR_PEP_ID=MMETSP0759-20121206/9228_1 /TAXON_ID=63605 /ORGANISM="Percolomonas cosmopolitus, Strain WS" /LENGTH=576 /DNA_ID=CAMNT_0005244479 /DNA_START=294 /DNA_END=2028 /DNA_ORIENTATION=+